MCQELYLIFDNYVKNYYKTIYILPVMMPQISINFCCVRVDRIIWNHEAHAKSTNQTSNSGNTQSVIKFEDPN